ncbi:MAG: hypothetical protein AB7V77_05430 [Candidatus Woesearchaeota archaeon]
MGFESLIYTLDNWGFMDVILPFILIFTIVFAVLEKTKILGKEDKQVRKYATIISLVVAFSIIVPHITGTYYYGFDAVKIINDALPQVGLLLVAIVMMLLTVGLWTGKSPDGSKGIGPWLVTASILFIIGIFAALLGWLDVPYWLRNLLNSDVMALVIALLVFGIIIKFIIGDDGSTSKAADGFKNFGNAVASFSGGGDDKKD